MRTLITSTILALSAFSAAAGPFDGNYYDRANGPSGDYCASARGNSSAEIIGNEVVFYETSCTLSNPVNVRGMDAQLYDAACGGEGSTYETRIMLMRPLDSDGIIVLTESYMYDWASCSAE